MHMLMHMNGHAQRQTDRQTRLTVVCPHTQEVGGEADRHTETDSHPSINIFLLSHYSVLLLTPEKEMWR